jgi:hypothetical protein
VNRRPRLLDVGALAIVVALAALVVVLGVLLAGRPCLDCMILPRARPIIVTYPITGPPR